MLLSHIQTGLIIDAFGELRDQQEQVKEDMEVKDKTLKVNTFSSHMHKMAASSPITCMCRQNASYVALGATTSTRRRMASRLTP